ncbi:hypothetical protein Taro_021374 [Colocasia esculenta]|uniref:SHSP domain-containing protein n=1 Tax=Colocasia esculenta TaxID=4460 RepID=A0A843V560_COLES|nr:hypothetical protein [Colocasia esculenta]
MKVHLLLAPVSGPCERSCSLLKWWSPEPQMEALTKELERVLDMAENELDMALDLPEAIQRALDFPDEMEWMLRPPARTYVKLAKAFLRTPADIYEYPDSYAFVLDMPGLEPDMIKVNVEDGRVLHVLGKRTKKPAAGEGEKKAHGEMKEEGGEGATTTAEGETKAIKLIWKLKQYQKII